MLGLNTNVGPVAELAKLGWTLCGAVAKKTQFEKQYFVNYDKSEFQKLRSRDVLGLEDVMQSEEFNYLILRIMIGIAKKGITKLHYLGNRIIHLYLATNS